MSHFIYYHSKQSSTEKRLPTKSEFEVELVLPSLSQFRMSQTCCKVHWWLLGSWLSWHESPHQTLCQVAPKPSPAQSAPTPLVPQTFPGAFVLCVGLLDICTSSPKAQGISMAFTAVSWQITLMVEINHYNMELLTFLSIVLNKCKIWSVYPIDEFWHVVLCQNAFQFCSITETA